MSPTEKYPILVTAKDRLRYLDLTLRSLSATVPPGVPVTVIDDGSSDPRMRQYLETNESIHLGEEDAFPGHKEWVERFGFIPNRTVIPGVRGKVRSYLSPHSLGTHGVGHAIWSQFQLHLSADVVIRVQDDVIFKAGWYEKFCHTAQWMRSYKIGILVGHRFFQKLPMSMLGNDGFDYLVRGYTGGCLLAFSHLMLERDPHIFDSDNLDIMHEDNLWIDRCRAAKLGVWVMNPGVCQHIGVRSVAYRDNNPRKQFLQKGQINLDRIDPNIWPPFEVAEEVKTFYP